MGPRKRSRLLAQNPGLAITSTHNPGERKPPRKQDPIAPPRTAAFRTQTRKVHRATNAAGRQLNGRGTSLHNLAFRQKARPTLRKAFGVTSAPQAVTTKDRIPHAGGTGTARTTNRPRADCRRAVTHAQPDHAPPAPSLVAGGVVASRPPIGSKTPLDAWLPLTALAGAEPGINHLASPPGTVAQALDSS